MSKANDDARKELDEILKGLMTDKKMKSSDKLLIATTISNRKKAQNIEFRKKVSNTKKGIKSGPFTEEHRSNISKAQLKNGGNGPSNHTEESKIKISESLSGRKYTKDHRAKISAGQKGGKGRQPLLTPHGVYKSRIEAIKNLTGVILNVARLIDKSTKIKNSGWKYITKEEYIMLTGKDPWNEK